MKQKEFVGIGTESEGAWAYVETAWAHEAASLVMMLWCYCHVNSVNRRYSS